MSQRFYSANPISGDQATIAGAEAHHLLHVMRAQIGDCVTLFDGSGDAWQAELADKTRSEVNFRILSRDSVDRESTIAITIAAALPKGDRQKWMVEKLTELGATRLVPLVTERSVAQPSNKALEKLRRATIEACKQCGRNRLMQIDEPKPLAEFIASDTANRRLIAHPLADEQRPLDLADAESVSVVIGPEGGFAEAEVAAARDAAWETFSLGPRILRTETAAMAVCCLTAYRRC